MKTLLKYVLKAASGFLSDLLTENIYTSVSQPGSRAIFTVTGGILKAATSTMKRVSVRFFKIRKGFHRSKLQL